MKHYILLSLSALLLLCTMPVKAQYYPDGRPIPPRKRAAYPGFSEDYNDNFNRFDGGIKVGCGLGFQMLYLEASYDVGLANVGKDDFEDTHTGTFNLTFGVNF
ncbi:hypothetical protein [Prevotella sp. S7 MS 2]|uniref:hypothetical protein n=1 Tax=Prevotella sp. S7 MS 2 TaxID=1287488 RepID=UPI0005140625|nr:hypothetical protein [Prevotella sp. S7 MS 2]KGI60494.1 hypothetical protein HMPREF0671_05670 [Prevotella sp. S7 MS 2]